MSLGWSVNRNGKSNEIAKGCRDSGKGGSGKECKVTHVNTQINK
jgi:hypothetical protein